MEIFLVRHTTVKTEESTCYGQLNVPVNELTFEKEFLGIANKLPTDFTKIYASRLERCKVLAEKIAGNKVVFDDNLLEVNFGSWEGKKWNEINQTELNHWMNNFVTVKPPKGENLLDLYKRVTNFIDNLRASKKNNSEEKIIIITHAGVIRCFYAYWLGIPLENIFKISVNYGNIHHLKLTNNKEIDLVFGKV